MTSGTMYQPAIQNSTKMSPFFLPLGMIIGSFILYACMLSKHYSEGEDSSAYVILVTAPESLGDLFHPNHLAYSALNRLVYLSCQQLGYHGDARMPMQVVNALAGSVALGLMVMILRQVKVDDRLIASWVAVTAVCFGFWSYSTQAETYILPLPPILLCIYLLVRLTHDQISLTTCAWIGCLGAVATLLHQQHVLVVASNAVAAAIIGYRCRDEVPMQRIVAGLGIMCVTAAAIIGTAYFSVAIGVLHLSDMSAIINWSKGHAEKGLWTPWSYSNPIRSLLVGFPRAVCGGHFLYGFDWFYRPVARMFPAKLVVEERYLAQHLPLWARLTCLAASIAALAAVLAVLRTLWFPVQTEPASREDQRRIQALDTILLLLIISYFIFNSLWEPVNIEFWIVLLPVVAIAIARLQARRPRAKGWWFAGAALAACLLVANGLGSIVPQASLDTDFWYQANLFLIRNARAGDVIVTDGAYISDMYLKIYTKAEVISARWSTNRLPEVLRTGDSRRVWISSWALEPLPEVRNSGLLPAADEQALQRTFEGVHDRMMLKDKGPYQTVWELKQTGL